MMMLWLMGASRAPVTVLVRPTAAPKPAVPGACALSAARCAAVPLAAPAAGAATTPDPELLLPEPEEAAAPQAAMNSPAPVRRTAQETAVMRDGIARPRGEPVARPGRVAPDGWPVRCPIGVSMLLGRARPAAGSPARR